MKEHAIRVLLVSSFFKHKFLTITSVSESPPSCRLEGILNIIAFLPVEQMSVCSSRDFYTHTHTPQVSTAFLRVIHYSLIHAETYFIFDLASKCQEIVSVAGLLNLQVLPYQYLHMRTKSSSTWVMLCCFFFQLSSSVSVS